MTTDINTTPQDQEEVAALFREFLDFCNNDFEYAVDKFAVENHLEELARLVVADQTYDNNIRALADLVTFQLTPDYPLSDHEAPEPEIVAPVGTTEKGMTARDLRQALYYVNNQEMTVKELRSALFQIDNQDQPLDIGFSFGNFIDALAAAK